MVNKNNNVWLDNVWQLPPLPFKDPSHDIWLEAQREVRRYLYLERHDRPLRRFLDELDQMMDAERMWEEAEAFRQREEAFRLRQRQQPPKPQWHPPML